MVVSTLALLLAVLQPQSVDTYGKTEAEILRMGQSSWYDFYTAKAGDSTAAMSSAYGIYADIAAARNDRLLADPRLPKRSQVKQLRKMLLEFGSDMVNLGTEITGGGTLWNTVSAQEYADAQDTVYSVIHRKGQPISKAVVVSDILKVIAEIPAKLKQSSGEGGATKDQLKAAPEDIRSAKALFRRIVGIASTYDRPTSNRILTYCLNQAKLVEPFGH